jgi:hypothetical protein
MSCLAHNSYFQHQTQKRPVCLIDIGRKNKGTNKPWADSICSQQLESRSDTCRHCSSSAIRASPSDVVISSCIDIDRLQTINHPPSNRDNPLSRPQTLIVWRTFYTHESNFDIFSILSPVSNSRHIFLLHWLLQIQYYTFQSPINRQK